MKHGSELDWLEEQPWWKKTLKWLGWLTLSIVAAAGLSNTGPFSAFAAFGSVWMVREKIQRRNSQSVGLWLLFTLLGLGFALANLFGAGDDPFWKGFIGCFAVMGGMVMFPLFRNYQNRIDYLEAEVEDMEFDWYRKQRFEKQQKEYAEWAEKNPGKSPYSFRFKKHSF
jgi:hypothetical protein